LKDRIEPYGAPLFVHLGKEYPKGEEVELHISLSTTEKCTALQWMEPAQTGNKKHPYMFSQCQAIHARSVFPCQDTPDVKATVDFSIRSPLPVVASGLPTGSSNYTAGKNGAAGTLLYTFKQAVPIPSYLFALASGDLATASIGPRSTVVTGPEELLDCKWEFEEDMEKFMDVAEKLVYPYAWGTYNVLVLPPAFPYGGMENPIFTFATPTIVSKDRQNVDVIAHELAHSWSGNLISCASWEHFWLNEGWTTYLERRIQAGIYGDDHIDFSSIIGWKALEDSVKNFGEDHEFTRLIVDLKGKDPDDAFSTVPYEKGFHFLWHMEKLVGREKWDKYIPHVSALLSFVDLANSASVLHYIQEEVS
jgi:leukotriene-A4 hydrolase